MAEGWAKELLADKVHAYSAGTKPQTLNPYAVKAMQSLGVDISSHWAKSVDDLAKVEFDYVYTVCGNADKNCPIFSGKAKVIHRGFDDPPHLAEGLSDEAEILKIYKRVSLEIKHWIEELGS